MARAWQYFKCNKCGKDGLLGSGNSGSYICECKNKVYYSEEVENNWLNEVDSNGERIRMDFTGSDEDDCRRNAAIYFGCDKQDIQNYYIVQKGGLFRKFTICATRPIKYEKDENAIKIVMWQYEDRPSWWADINLEEKTILYPYALGEKKQKFDKIVGIRKEKNEFASRDFTLILEPQGEVSFSFMPGHFDNIDLLFQIVEKAGLNNGENYGMYEEKFMANAPLDAQAEVFLEMESNEYHITGNTKIWKDNNKLFMLNVDTYQCIIIPLDNIKYYRLIGQKYVTTEITGGGGGGTSIKGAIVGGLIAGEVGAVVGSRKKIDEVKGTSTIHDEQIVLMYSIDLGQVISFNSNAYEIFVKLIPEKEYNEVVESKIEKNISNNEVTKNNVDIIREFKKLLDEGIISQDEFDKKKKELLGL